MLNYGLDPTVAQLSKLAVSAQTKIESWATAKSNIVKLSKWAKVSLPFQPVVGKTFENLLNGGF